MIQVWGESRGRQGLDPLRHLRDGGGMCGPTIKRGLSQGGDPTGLEMKAGGVEVALTRCQTKAGPHLGRPRSGSLKTRPIKLLPRG